MDYTLKDYLIFEPQKIRALRRSNKLNQAFHQALIEWPFCGDYEDLAEDIINLAYYTCAKFMTDTDPTNDIYYTYVNDIFLRFNNKQRCAVCLYFASILLNALRKEHGISDDIVDEFLSEISYHIDNELKKVYHNYTGDRICHYDYWVKKRESLEDLASKMNITELLTVKPCPPDKIPYSLFTYTTMAEATNGYDQDEIRSILSRYSDPEVQLAMLNIIRNLFSGLTAQGEMIPDDLPF